MGTRTAATEIPTAGVRLDADLIIPDGARGLVIFAHGSGSSRRSPRNRAVADVLNHAGLATALVDLLTPAEARLDEVTGSLRFDIGLLADRLVGMIDWLSEDAQTRELPIGLFGASTGAAAALVAAAARPASVQAVVSRGGRPDLAGPALIQVEAPTLLLVGESDQTVRDLNEQARNSMTTNAELHIVPQATHLFPEPGAMRQVADHATTWFHDHLMPPGHGTPRHR